MNNPLAAVSILVTRCPTEDEEWPVINLHPEGTYPYEIDIPVALAHRYEAAKREWDAVQEELAALWPPHNPR